MWAGAAAGAADTQAAPVRRGKRRHVRHAAPLGRGRPAGSEEGAFHTCFLLQRDPRAVHPCWLVPARLPAVPV